MREIVQEHQQGGQLTPSGALVLAGASGVDFFGLQAYANFLCEGTHGKRVSFVVNRNINFTNVCTQRCKFCAFSVPSGDAAGFLLSMEEIARKTREAQTAGCTEVCIQGGLHPSVNLDYYLEILATVQDVAPEMHVHAFSPQEVYYMSRKSGLAAGEVLRKLKGAGLGSLPGTAAEILVDSVRERLCPEKISTRQWVEIVRTAHELGIPSTSTIMFGSIETWADRFAHMQVIRKVQQKTGMITEFVPLAFVRPANGFLDARDVRPLSGPDILKLYAIARIFFHDTIKNLQTSWVKLGPTLAQVTLQCGVNDFSGTLMEENISKSAGARFGEYLPPEQMVSYIRAAGKVPVQRGTTYDVIREY